MFLCCWAKTTTGQCYNERMVGKILVTTTLCIFVILVGASFFHRNSAHMPDAAPDTAACLEPLTFASPIDINNATSVLWPGQVRGGDYKRHGGFRFDNSVNNEVEVRAPIHARLTAASRYIEMGHVQYLLDFETDCGIRYRFDHLLTLTPKLAATIEKLPKPKLDDSRTSRIHDNVQVETNEVIAVEVGIADNVFLDFGVYDSKGMRTFGNPIKNPLCAFEYFSPEDAEKFKLLAARDDQDESTSDICVKH